MSSKVEKALEKRSPKVHQDPKAKPATKKAKAAKKSKPNAWIKATKTARASMAKKYPKEFKGFIPMRSNPNPACKTATRAEKDKHKLGYMFYLNAKEEHAKMQCKK
jgi:hypothetical protein